MMRTDPPVSEKQDKLMRAVAHNKEFASKVGIPQSVGKEFTRGDCAVTNYMDAVRRGDCDGINSAIRSMKK